MGSGVQSSTQGSVSRLVSEAGLRVRNDQGRKPSASAKTWSRTAKNIASHGMRFAAIAGTCYFSPLGAMGLGTCLYTRLPEKVANFVSHCLMGGSQAAVAGIKQEKSDDSKAEAAKKAVKTEVSEKASKAAENTLKVDENILRNIKKEKDADDTLPEPMDTSGDIQESTIKQEKVEEKKAEQEKSKDEPMETGPVPSKDKAKSKKKGRARR